jgi:signal transduction histidine kinase
MPEELDAKREEVSESVGAIEESYRVAMIAFSYAETTHSARRYWAYLSNTIEILLHHEIVRDDKELFGRVKQAKEEIDNLREHYDRLHRYFFFSYGEPSFKICQLAELIQQARAYLEPTLREKAISFSASLANKLTEVQADNRLMQIVFISIIRNRIEAGARRIRIKDRKTTLGLPGLPSEEAIEILFTDDGIDIPQNQWSDIFKFFTARDKGRNGMELAICRPIMNIHQGTIRVISSEAGKGTTIAVTWPTDLS